MKVAYILTTFPKRSEVFAKREISELRQLGLEIDVLAFRPESEQYSDSQFNVFYKPKVFSIVCWKAFRNFIWKYPMGFFRMIYCIFSFLFKSPREAFLLLKNVHTVVAFIYYLDLNQIYHIHAYFINLPAIVTKAICLVSNRTYSISCHAKDLFVESGAVNFKVSNAKFVSVCTEFGMKKLKAIIEAQFHNKVICCRHGVDIEETKEIVKSEVLKKENFESFCIIGIGRYVHKKGFLYLLKAFKKIVNFHPDCMLMLVGEGDGYDMYVEYINQNGLTGNVVMIGWEANERILQRLALATVLVVPSCVDSNGDQDGIPNVIIEAQALGVPVVASDLESIREIIIQNETGILVKAGDSDELAKAIISICKNKRQQIIISEKAFEFVYNNFQLSNTATKYLNLFNGVNERKN